MPIKPENRHRYPPDWREIRAEVLARASYQCEWPGCGIGHGWIGYRDERGIFQRLEDDDEFATVADLADVDGCYLGYHVIRIVLTIAHLDHRPENCDRRNLRAWCQKHHLAYDREHHQQTAYTTRKQRAATLDLFPEPTHEH